MAERALDKRRHIDAERLANELLGLAEDYPEDWNYGNALHEGHRILGMIRFQERNIEEAKIHLIAAGLTPGSPQLNTFGPNMQLAKRLLEAGELAVVIEYFELCRRFWRQERGRLTLWSSLVQEGKIPDFRGNL